MTTLIVEQGQFPRQALAKTIAFLKQCQLADGSIPWDKEGKLDPWDNIESAMGLSIAGEYHAAERAYQWLLEKQLDDGSWWANYRHGQPVIDSKRETNFIAYIATGVWHHYLITKNKAFVEKFYPCVKRAINCVLKHQSSHGEIAWAYNTEGQALDDALLTGCSSIYKSLECAIHRKSRYSMDWFYPILAGIYQGEEAKQRLAKHWDKFVRSDMGCVCVSDQPWVTVAESCELTLALIASGQRAKAQQLYSWLHQWADKESGGYWTGYQYTLKEFWPIEQTSWTAAAILLAADALSAHTPAAKLFLSKQPFLEQSNLNKKSS